MAHFKSIVVCLALYFAVDCVNSEETSKIVIEYDRNLTGLLERNSDLVFLQPTIEGVVPKMRLIYEIGKRRKGKNNKDIEIC